MGYGVGMAKNASTLVKNINVLIVQVPPNFLHPRPNPIIFKIIFYFKNLKFYNTNQRVPRRQKNKHQSE